MLGVGKPEFCGRREPECLRHFVHWHTPFYVQTCELAGWDMGFIFDSSWIWDDEDLRVEVLVLVFDLI